MVDNPFSEAVIREIEKEVNSVVRVEADAATLRTIFSLLDLTSLNATDSYRSVAEMCRKVNGFEGSFSGIPQVAAICIFPRFVPVAVEQLKARGVSIASVAGSFPASQTFIDNKADECRMAVEAGADELDVVISLGEFMDGRYDLVATEIETMKKAAGEAHLKVILETGVIGSPGLIYEASMIAMQAGADFIKTSTGKAPVSATPEAAWVMCRAIADYRSLTGRRVGFKPAGGISTAAEALTYFSVVKSLLGKEWLNNRLFRIGASRLANNLLSEIAGREVAYY